MLDWEVALRSWWSILPALMLLLAMALVGGQAVAGASERQGFAPATSHAQSGYVVPPLAPLDTPTAAATPNCPPSWNVVSSPNPSASTNDLFGVAAVSANDVWAVGTYHFGGGIYGDRTLALHWDGTQWTQIPSPSPGTLSDELDGVAAISSNDVWAVGVTYSSDYFTLVEHWNGSQWSVVPSPNVGFVENYLLGVSAVSTNDVWAVGYYLNNQGYDRTLTEHWNGSQWSVVQSPNVGGTTTSNGFRAVSAASANDVWAVGDADGVGALTEHWNGVQWSIIPNPNPPNTLTSNLEGVSALASNDVWAAGTWSDTSSRYNHTLIKHWDGVQWSVITSPDEAGPTNWLYGVAAISSSDVWAVGYYCCTSIAGTLAEHWDGVQWSVVSSANPSTSNNYFEAVSAISSNDVWAVGYDDATGWATLTEHYTDQCPPPPSLSPSPTPTYTTTPTPTDILTMTMTATPTTTNTPSATATPLPVLVGHVNWEGRPPQPNALQQLPITLTLKLGTTEVDYPPQITDQYGFFTVTVSGLSNGMYNLRVDDITLGQHSPNYLANSGVVNITGAPITNVEMGLMRAGDCNHDNVINTLDFSILKNTFGKAQGDAGYDQRADFNGNNFVNAQDFNLLRANFGLGGAPPIRAKS